MSSQMWFQGEIILHKPRENAISANWSIDEIMKDSYSHDSSWLGLEKKSPLSYNIFCDGWCGLHWNARISK